MEREILAVSVRCGEQPECELREHEVRVVACGMFTVGEEPERVRDRGSAVGLVAQRMRQSHGLAEVFLWQARDPGRLGRLEALSVDGGCAPPAPRGGRTAPTRR